MSGLLKDFGYAFRRLGAQLGFSAAAVFTLALGIGMTTAIFSLVDASILKSLPFKEADRLVFLQGYAASPDGPRIRGGSFAEIRDWRELNRSFSDVKVIDSTSFNLTGPEWAERVMGEFVSPGYFELLGASPLLGRAFEPAGSASQGPAAEAVIGEALWERRYGRSEDILGSRIVINNTPLTVVGVMPAAFSGMSFTAEVWAPESVMWLLGAPGDPETRGTRWLGPVASLRDGVSVAAAQKDMDAVAADLSDRFPATNTDRGVLVTPVRDVYLGNTGTLVWALFGAVALLLAIACANVSNLYLVRASARRHEVVLRAALGARRRELVRMYLAESLVIAASAALFGLLLAYFGVLGLAALAPQGFLPPYAEIALNWRSFGIAAVLSLLVGVLCGIAPAVFGYRADVAEGIKGGARGATAWRGLGFRQVMAVTEIALALTVVTAALLMMRSFQNQLAVEPGFDASSVLAFRLELPEADYRREEMAPFVGELSASLEAIPGVESASIGSSLPLRDRSSANFVALPDRPETPIRVYRHHVTPGYFQTMGIPLLSGQPFAGTSPDEPVTIVSEAFAKRFFPGRDAVGESLQLGEDMRLRIIGIAADVRYRDLTSDMAAAEDDPDFYMSYEAFPDRSFDVAVRTHMDPASLVEPVKAAVSRIDPGLPAFDVAPMDGPLAAETAQSRFGSMLLAAFSFTAIVLAAIGIYGVMSFMVAERSREFAIRMAAGASGPAIRRLVFRRSMLLALIGIPIGLAGAVTISRFMDALLFGVGDIDLATHGAALALLIGVVGLSVWLPASRAARTDLVNALRYE